MSVTTRTALVTAALCLTAGLAMAKPPRHVVVLNFDGPRTLADSGRTAVILALSEYDLVATPRWQEAQVKAHEDAGAQGSTVWRKAAESTGVDAVIDGWVQDKQLTVIVHDATDGSALEQLTVKVGKDGLGELASKQLRLGLEERLAVLRPLPQPKRYKPVPRTVEPQTVSAEARIKPAPTPTPATPAAAPPPTPEPAAAPAPAHAPVVVATVTDPKCTDVFGDCPAVREAPEPQPTHVPVATPRFRLELGGEIGSRSLHFQAETVENISQYDGVGQKALSVSGELYPFPLVATDGQLSGPGVSLTLHHTLGSTVGIDDEETTGDYSINENGFLAAVHWRQPVGKIVHLDGEVGYSQDNYVIEDPPEDYEVPDTAYSSLHAGAHCDLTVAPRATVGFGARYFYVLDQGDLTSTAFYGPGNTSGWGLDAAFVLPLPKQLYVRGKVAYKRYKTTFAGGGDITDEENVFDGTDSTVEGGAAIGIEF